MTDYLEDGRLHGLDAVRGVFGNALIGAIGGSRDATEGVTVHVSSCPRRPRKIVTQPGVNGHVLRPVEEDRMHVDTKAPR